MGWKSHLVSRLFAVGIGINSLINMILEPIL